jgi:D-alanyl-D-alanine carboxypeptidase
MRYSIKTIKKDCLLPVALFLIIILPAAHAFSHDDYEIDDGDTTVIDLEKVIIPEISKRLIPGIVSNEGIPRAGLLYDVEQRTIVWEKNPETAFPIASLTKMMVGLITVEDIKAGKYSWDTEVVVTREASHIGGSSVYLKQGDKLTMQELVKAAMISSGNDAAYLLAQFNGGSEANFVVRMNERAKELGMEVTQFSNSSGLPARYRAMDNRSSPMDLLKLALEMLKHDELVYISGMGDAKVNISNRQVPLKNHNRLAVDFTEVEGLKTGYTRNAMFCLVATSYRCSHRLIGVALGVQNSSLRNAFVADMMNNYFDHIGLGKMGEAEDAPPSLAIKYSFSEGKPVAELVKREPVIVPKSVTNAYASNLSAPATTTPKYYRVKKGDNLNAIASRHGCTVQELRSWNRLGSTRIYANQTLKIYSKQSATPKTQMAVSEKKETVKTTPVPTNQDKEFDYYIVQKGDTLWNIAQKYNGVTVKELMQINNIKNTKSLMPGMKLKVKSS